MYNGERIVFSINGAGKTGQSNTKYWNWTTNFFFFNFRPHCVACGILVSPPGITPMFPAMEALRLNQWTTRQVPGLLYTKTNSKWIKDLNIRPETVKFLEETIEGSLLDTSLDNDFFFFLYLTPKTQATKAKLNKWDDIKLKSFCTAKEKGKLFNGRDYLQIIYM